MAEPRRQLRLAQEAIPERPIVGQVVGEPLDGDDAAQLTVVGAW